MLDDALSQIVPMLAPYGITLIISDNASTDNTEDIVRRYQKKYKHIMYSCNAENIGPDKNFEKVIKLAKTDYAWLIGDGTRFEENAVRELLNILQKKYQLVVVNQRMRVKNIPTQLYTDSQKLFLDLGWHMTLLSSLVYSRELIIKGDFFRYYETNFLQVGVIFEYLAFEKCNVFWYETSVMYHSDIPRTNSWRPVAFDIFLYNWMRFVLSLPPVYSIESKFACILAHGEKTGLFTFTGILNLWLKGAFNRTVYKKYRKYFKYVSPVRQPVLAFLSIIPQFFVDGLYNIAVWLLSVKEKINK